MAEKHDFSKMFLNAEIKPIPNLQAELKSCPFCDGEANFISFVDITSLKPACVVKCVKCGTQTRDFVAEDNTFSYREQAKAQWNTRTPQKEVENNVEN